MQDNSSKSSKGHQKMTVHFIPSAQTNSMFIFNITRFINMDSNKCRVLPRS
jgi:hypothetical protein